MVDFSQLNIDKDALVNTLAYNYAESPSTQAYLSTAAANNPDYAQMIGNIARFGDIDRANFNLGMQALAQTNAKKRQDELSAKMFQRQKALIDHQAAAQEKQRKAMQAEADARALSLEPDLEYLPTITNYANEESPEYTAYRNEDSALVDAGNKAKYEGNLIEFNKIRRLLEQKRNNPLSKIKPIDTLGVDKSRIVSNNPVFDTLAMQAETDPQKRKLIGLTNIFNEKPLQNYNIFERMWDAVRNTSREKRIFDTMQKENVNSIPWDANALTKHIANQIMNDELAQQYFGTHNLNHMRLLTDPSTNYRKMYLVNTKNGTIFRLQLDNNGNFVDAFDVADDDDTYKTYK